MEDQCRFLTFIFVICSCPGTAMCCLNSVRSWFRKWNGTNSPYSKLQTQAYFSQSALQNHCQGTGLHPVTRKQQNRPSEKLCPWKELEVKPLQTDVSIVNSIIKSTKERRRSWKGSLYMERKEIQLTA